MRIKRIDHFLKANQKVIIAVSLIALFAVDKTFAWVAPILTIDNELSGHETKVEIEENFKTIKDETSGAIKEVTFRNIGDSDVFIRMSYAEYWNYTDEKGEKWQLPNTNSESKKEIAIKKFAPEKNDTGKPDASLWSDGNDGWYYYNKILPAGASTELVLEKVTFPEEYPDKKYDSAEYHLYFKVEAVQASTSSKTLNREEVNAKVTTELFGKLSWAKVDFEGGGAPKYSVIWNFKQPYGTNSENGGSD